MNYTGDHPLNLIGKVAIVTSAASPTGAAICRELLNSNANVLGIDRRPAHPTTTARKGSHFQFFQFARGSPPSGHEVLEYSRSTFFASHVDFLINVIEEDRAIEESGLTKQVLGFMESEKGGLVLNVLISGQSRTLETKVIDETRTFHAQYKAEGVSCNVVVAHGAAGKGDRDPVVDRHTQAAMKEHIDAHLRRREKGGYAVHEERDLANLVLFLCTRIGREISGVLLGTGGNAIAL